MNPEWLIIGGGIHGVHLAARLLLEGKVQPDHLLIVDPAETLFWQAPVSLSQQRRPQRRLPQ